MSNARSLETIAGEIYKLERASVFDIGDLLIEAKEQLCQHGEWIRWLFEQFDYSADTAQNYMNAARVAAKNRTVRF